MNIGSKLQEYRTKNNFTVEDLADKLGIEENTIISWESDESVPSESKLYELATIYEVSLDELLGEAKDKLITPETKPQKAIKAVIKLSMVLGIIFAVLIVFMIVYAIITSIK